MNFLRCVYSEIAVSAWRGLWSSYHSGMVSWDGDEGCDRVKSDTRAVPRHRILPPLGVRAAAHISTGHVIVRKVLRTAHGTT